MKSTIKRSIVIGGRKTSVSLEDAFWVELRKLAMARNLPVGVIVAEIDARRDRANLSSAIRLHILEHFRRPKVDLEIPATPAVFEAGG
jgi:predicted DNA-binding ribbon-helix-helix protein